MSFLNPLFKKLKAFRTPAPLLNPSQKEVLAHEDWRNFWYKNNLAAAKGDTMTEEKTETKPVAIFDTERGEREKYFKATEAQPIRVPLTRDGFDALMEVVCDEYDLPNDDSARQVIATHVHHIPNDCDETTIEKLGVVLRKAASNALTWGIDQEIKAKRNAAAIAAREEGIAKMEAEAERKRAMGAANVAPSGTDTQPN